MRRRIFRDPGQHRNHSDLTKRRLHRGIDDRDKSRIDDTLGARRGPFMQPVIKPDVG